MNSDHPGKLNHTEMFYMTHTACPYIKSDTAIYVTSKAIYSINITYIHSPDI